MRRWAVAKLSAGAGSLGLSTGLVQPVSQPRDSARPSLESGS